MFTLHVVSGQRCLSVTALRQKHASYSVTQDGVAVIRLDSPGSKVNSLNEEVFADFESIFNDIQNKAEIKSAVLASAKPGCWIAGADIKMIEK